MKIKPTIAVNLHCEEGRAMFQLDLSSLSSDELKLLVKSFDRADKGNKVEFGAEPTPDQRLCLYFTLGEKAIEECLVTH